MLTSSSITNGNETKRSN